MAQLRTFEKMFEKPVAEGEGEGQLAELSAAHMSALMRQLTNPEEK